MMMKKIQNKSIFSRFSRLLAVVTVTSVFFLTSCDLFTYKRPFDDAYYDNNFIAGIGFDKFVGDVATVPAIGSDPTTGMWDFAYRYLDWDAYSYMTLHVTDTVLPVADPGLTVASFGAVPSGLSPIAPVYRLSLVNLIADGDFETATGGSWTGTGTATRDITASPNNPLFGSASMKLVTDIGENIIYTPSLIGSPPGFSGALYNAYFRFRSSAGSFNVSIQDSNAIPVSSSADVKYSVVLHPGLTSAPSFIFEPILGNVISALWLDNFRLARSGNMEFRLLLSQAQTIPALIDGVYSFSVWVHSDPLSFSDSSPFNMDTFTVTMKETSSSSLSVNSATYNSGTGTGWIKLTATLARQALQFSSNTQPVLELSLQFNDSRPGSILLASPELRFHPDGL